MGMQCHTIIVFLRSTNNGCTEKKKHRQIFFAVFSGMFSIFYKHCCLLTFTLKQILVQYIVVIRQNIPSVEKFLSDTFQCVTNRCDTRLKSYTGVLNSIMSQVCNLFKNL